MTAKQKQLILCCFDLMDLEDVDGIWGEQSEAATRKLQRGLGIEEDGVFGDGTRDAAFARLTSGEPLADDITDTNVGNKGDEDINVPAKTGTFWDEIEFFTREEFRCQCGGRYCNGFHVEPDETTVRLCNEIRRRAGVPILIRDAGGSGLRCPQWNATTPGAAANSYHTKGMAADLHPRGKTPEQLYAIAEAVMAEMIPGRGGLGLYNWGIHVDKGEYSRWDNRG